MKLTYILVVLSVLLVVFGSLWFLWRHRAGVVARGIGSASAEFNKHHGFPGQPSEVVAVISRKQSPDAAAAATSVEAPVPVRDRSSPAEAVDRLRDKN